MPRSSLWTCSPLLIALAVPAYAAMPDPRALELAFDAWAKPLADGSQLSGNVLVARGSHIMLERSFGMAERELRVANTPQTRFCIASITKPITIIVAEQLIDEGKLSRTDLVGRWLPTFPGADSITVDHLLRHQSGIPHRVTNEEQESQPRTAADMVDLASRVSREFRPGSRASYSSAGYSVLARVLELAGGAPYESLIARRVFRPAGMTRSAHLNSRVIVADRASSYVQTAGELQNAPLKDLSFLVGAGSVISTARDLHRLVLALLDGRLGKPSRETLVRGGRIQWNGSTNGFRCFANWDSATNVILVFTGNLQTGAPDLAQQALEDILAGREASPMPTLNPRPIALPDSLLRSYEGLYRLPGGVTLPIRAKDGKLMSGDWPLIPTSRTTFFSSRDYAQVTVIMGAGLRPERLDWKIGRKVTAVVRVGDLP